MIKKERNSNFELMRIISMLLIVIGHTLSWGGITGRTSGITTYFIYIIYALIVVHVNSFVLLTGYYQSNSKFRIIKVINLLLLMLFYRVAFYAFCVLIGWKTFNGWYMFIFDLLPLSNFSYWFLNIYIVLYMIAPFLNKLVSSLNKENYKLLLSIMFIFCAIIPRITLNSFIDNSAGYSLIHFVFMYLVGAYLNKNYNVGGDLNRIRIKNKSIFYLSLFLVLAALKYTINFFGFRLMLYGDSEILKTIGKYLSYFVFFKSINIKSKIINYIARCVNEVYLIHMNINIRPHLYLLFGLSLNYYTYRAIPMAIIISIVIFAIGLFVYNVRKIFVNYFNRCIINNNLIKTIKDKLDVLDERINSI